MRFLDFRLPYFYHLPVCVLLVINVFYRIDAELIQQLNECLFRPDLMDYFRLGLSVLPASTAAVYFYNQFKMRNDLLVRQSALILMLVHFLSYLLPSFLPYR